jgi:hypothetical protein
MQAEGLWPLANGSNYAKSKQNTLGQVCRQKVCGHWRRAQSMQKANKISWAGYAGGRSVATCERLTKSKSKQNNPGRVCRQKVCGHWRRAQSIQKASKIRRAGYAGKRSVATGETLKVCKKQTK